jgi:antitoxin (DNA-binding transcriptional repressor) of toxin-antitoxin stability system
MPAIVTIRDLRNRFPQVRKLVEAEGEVLLSESGKTKYLLRLYTRPRMARPPAKDYMARLKKFQPRPISKAAAKAIHAENRGER